jgi:flavin reductase (DIM6/NTAB) family NADH-FMN oxidoreductase RutF
MDLVKQFRTGIKRVIFGPANIPHFCNVGLRDPQAGIRICLYGWGPPQDVTYRNVIAGTRPLMIGIGLGDKLDSVSVSKTPLWLKFRESGDSSRLLGEISLKFVDTIAIGRERLSLFLAVRASNYCLPKNLLWRRYLQFAYSHWRNARSQNTPESQISERELHALFVFYICPRPVVLVSVAAGNVGNIFPMDLVGPVGGRHFSLTLHNSSTALPLIQDSRRVALSGVPIEQMPLAYKLGANHKRPSVDWASMPFALTTSPAFALPVPQFALRVREIEVEQIRRLGTHTFFISKIVEDQRWTEGQQFFQAHGFYEGWRQRTVPFDVAIVH